MSTRISLVLLLLVASQALAQEVPLRNEQEKTLYALGLQLAKDLEPYALGRKEFPFVVAGLADGVLSRESRVDPRKYQRNIAQLARVRVAQVESESARKFLQAAAREKGATTTDSGIVIRELRAGTGASPSRDATVLLHYHGTLRDGRVFDSTRSMRPATFVLKGALPCWREVLPRMRVGGKAHVVCPPEQAYGDRGAPPNISPGAALSFDLELVEIVE